MSQRGRRAIILDRDATLIDVVRDEETGAITTAFHPDQIALLAGVVDALRLFAGAGYALAIATNQPGPAKGHFSRDAVNRTNDALVATLARDGLSIASVQTCFHHPEGGPRGDASLVGACDCRKPKPGLLTAVARDLGVTLTESWMVGDSASDVEAGAAAGARTALVFPSNRCELCPLRDGIGSVSKRAVPDVRGETLLAVAREIIARG